MTQRGTVEVVAQALGELLAPLADRLGTTASAKGLFAELGLNLPDDFFARPGFAARVTGGAQAAGVLPAKVRDLTDAVQADDLPRVVATSAALLADIRQVVSAIEALGTELANSSSAVPGVSTADLHQFSAELPDRLVNLLAVEHLARHHPSPLAFLKFFGLVEEIAERAAVNDPSRPTAVRRRLRPDRLPDLITNPLATAVDRYRWGGPNLDFASLLDALRRLLVAIGRLAYLEPNGPGGLPQVRARDVHIAPRADSSPPGIELALLFNLALSQPLEGQLAPGLDVRSVATAVLPASTTVTVKPPLDLSVHPPSTPVSGKLELELRRHSTTPGAPTVLLGVAGGPRVEAGALTLRVTTDLAWNAASSTADAGVAVEAAAEQGKVVISLGGADGFLSSILPADGLVLDVDLGIGYSPSRGVYAMGAAGLEVDLPVNLVLGPVKVTSLHVGLGTRAGDVELELSSTIHAAFGPLEASVERMGFKALATFPEHGGNLHFANLTIGFKPPSGVGLTVDAGIVSGGGYLYIDTDRGEYAGALQLKFAGFLDLAAVGLISTKMPDGSSGFSLLIIVTADFGAGIQLGFGFTLNAVGGLIGLNRGMLFQPLMDGVRSNAIESIMFPRDVVANAPRIISDLRAIFPPREGTFLIGPMAKLGWGEPTLVTLSLGVIIEVPPGDIAILGVLKLALPAEELAILSLQVNFAGALEFDKKRLYFFASLFDSHILFITLEGEMGLLFAWGDDANFVVSVGGFHPQFNPPPLPFPSPRRIEVDIINESFARIRCDGYFAVTTNTVQFGTHSEFFFGFSACSVEGHSGFDALIQFSPFHFTVSISTSFSVKVFGFGMFGIDIDLTLEGPTPFHAVGSGSLTFFFFSVSIPIDFTFGDSRETTLPPVAVMPILAGELGKRSNWKAVLPSGSNLLVSLRKLDPSESQFVLHPVGTLQISQRAVPLDLALDKVGSQRPSDANRFALTATSGDLVKRRDLQEPFAPAQFKNFDDAGKLSQAAYSPHDSGIELSAAGHVYRSGTAITRIVRYDLTIIDTKLLTLRRRFFSLSGDLFRHFLRGSSVTRSSLSTYHDAQTHPFDGTVRVAAEQFVVAWQWDNTALTSGASFTSHAAASDHLVSVVFDDPSLEGSLHVLPAFEVAA